MHRGAHLPDFQAAQLGLITLDQIRSTGGTRNLASHRVKAGAWERVLPSAHAPGPGCG